MDLFRGPCKSIWVYLGDPFVDWREPFDPLLGGSNDPQGGSNRPNYWPQSTPPNGSFFNFLLPGPARKLDKNPFAAQNLGVRPREGCSRGQKNFASLSGWRSDWPPEIVDTLPCVFGGKKPRCLAKRTAQRFFKKGHPSGGVSERLPSNFLTPPHRLDWEGFKSYLGTLSGLLLLLTWKMPRAVGIHVRTVFPTGASCF